MEEGRRLDARQCEWLEKQGFTWAWDFWTYRFTLPTPTGEVTIRFLATARQYPSEPKPRVWSVLRKDAVRATIGEEVMTLREAFKLAIQYRADAVARAAKAAA